MTIKGLLWNARGWRSKETEILKRAQEYDILFITETESKRDDRITISGFDTYSRIDYRQDEGGAGGVAVFVRKYIRRQELDLSYIKDNLDAVGIRVEGDKEIINFICFYRRPSKTERREYGKRS